MAQPPPDPRSVDQLKDAAASCHGCDLWEHARLEAEVEVVRPRLMVLMRATAAQSVMGLAFRVTRQRGEVMASPIGVPILATVHPSSILRAPDEAARDVAFDEFTSDLMVGATPEAKCVGGAASPGPPEPLPRPLPRPPARVALER